MTSTVVTTGFDGSVTTGLEMAGAWPFLPLSSTAATGLFAGPLVISSPPNFPTWTVQEPAQAPNQVKGISAPPGFQGTPPPIDPAVGALQAVALTKGLI